MTLNWILLLLTSLAGPAWAGIGPQVIQNGAFGRFPVVKAYTSAGTSYTIAAGTDLGAWYSGVPYYSSDEQPGAGQVSVQRGTRSYTGTAQVSFPGDNSVTPVAPATATYLLFRGNGAAADLWYQHVSVLPGTTYTFSFYASNANPVGTTGTTGLPVLSLLVNNTAQNATYTLANEASTDTWTRYTYTVTTGASQTDLELRLRNPSTGTASQNQVAITGLLLRANSASSGAAFSCDGAFYQIRQVDVSSTDASQGNSTKMFTVNTTASPYTTTLVRDLTATVNALSYDPSNGYLYCLTYTGNYTTSTSGQDPQTARQFDATAWVEINRIGQGGIESLGAVSGLPVMQWAAGTVDRSNNLYLKDQAQGSTIYKLNLTASPITATTITTSSAFTSYDLAFNPVDNMIYGVYFPGVLYKFDPSTSTPTLNTIDSGSYVTNQPLGSAFFNFNGDLFAYGNGNATPATSTSGKFYRLNTSTAAIISQNDIPGATNSDGASCINASSTIDVVKQLTSVNQVSPLSYDVTYTVRLANTGTVTAANVQVSDLLTGNANNTTFPNASSVVLQGSIAVNNLDGSALAANTAFTGISGNAGLLTGNQPLTAGQRASITFTVRVNYASGNVPSATRNNTAYATSASQTNPGYTQDASGNLISPTGLQAMDASTNSTDATYYPPSRTSAAADTPSPTPLTFTPGLFGTVFEDVNYGGGAGRTLSASSGVARPTARVELYSGSGTSATFVSATTTDASGAYAFTNLMAGNSYVVRVVNNGTQAVSSSRPGATSSLLPVQTYAYNADATVAASRVGGQDPQRVDAANVTSVGTTLASLSSTGSATAPGTIAQSLSAVTLPGNSANSTTGVDFGFNFDVVTNTNDKGQGSLRQFILNSNALGGESSLAQSGANAAGSLTAGQETSLFMIPDGAAHPGLLANANGGPASQLSSGVAAIVPASMLPAVTGVSTTIDGTTQTQNIGNTNNVTLGTGGTVGTGGTALSQLNGPEVQLKGTRSYEGLSLTANSVTVRGLSIYGFTNDIGVGTDYTGTLIEQNVLGTSATSFTDPGANVRSTGQGINYYNADNGTLRNNLIGFNGGMGIWVLGDVNGANNNTISGNEIRGNAQEVSVSGEGLVFDGLELQGASTGNTLTANLITASIGHGIDSYGNTVGGNTITGNTISNNGQGLVAGSGVEGSGLRVYGATNTTTISGNILSGNNGSGVLVENTAAKVIISQNAIFGNTRVGIDLLSNADANTTANTYNGNTGTTSNVTLNSSATTGGNSLLNYPIITSATLVGTNLLVQGYAKANAAIELFVAQANSSTSASPNNLFGQGSAYLTTVTEGSAADTNPATSQSYSGSVNGTNQGSDSNANGFSFLVPLTTAQQAAVKAGTLLTSTATLGGATSEFSGNATTTVTAPLVGYVYEDMNYGGGLGRSRATAGSAAVGRPGAKVELYDNTGAYVSTAITDANGQYAFNVVPAAYTVRVLNNSVLSSRGQAASTYSGDATSGYLNTLLPVQTYNGSTDRVGGENPKYTDAPANSGSQTLASLSSGTVLPESVAATTVTQAASTNAGPDFGYNFDTVVNTNDVAVSGNNTQGSLRQFILNSNALGNESTLAPVYTPTSGATTALATGLETSIFMIPNGAAVAGQRAGLASGFASGPNNGSGSAATITLASALPDVTGSATAIDGSTQTRSTGDSNAAVTTAGAESTGPEVLLNANSQATSATGALYFTGSSDQLLNLGVYGSNGSVGIGVGIGSGAQFMVIQNNTINTNGANITFTGTQSAKPSTATIAGNIIRDSQRGNADGIELNGNNSNMTITGNQLLRNSAFGIDFITGANSNNVITNNTFVGNGAGGGNGNAQLSGIGIRSGSSNNNTIANNTFLNNNGAGIIAKSGTTGNIFSQNTFQNNGNAASNALGFGLGIDLMAGTSNDNGDGDGVTINDNGDTDTGANGLVNFPILQRVVLNSNGTLTVTGYASPGARVELYLAAADPTGFGEGQTYLATFTQGSASGATSSVTMGSSATSVGINTTGAAGTYGAAAINGLSQGTDNTNAFSVTFTPTATQLALLQRNTSLLTATATFTTATGGNFGTSEFSGNARILNAPPVPNDVANASVPNNATTAVALSPNLSGTASGLTTNVTSSAANSVASYTVSPLAQAANGTLYYQGAAITAATGPVAVPVANLGQLTFLPTRGFVGSVTFTYTATDANGLVSTTHSTGGTVSGGPAIYTIPVTASADVTTTITGPGTLSAGQPSGTFTTAFTNNGPNDAATVTQTVALPGGATLTQAQQSAITSAYPGASFNTAGGATTITFPSVGTLAAGASVVRQFAFTAPTATGAASITSTVSTATSQGVDAAPNSATMSLTVNAVADVATTISANAASVAAGGTGQLNVTFSNNGPQDASGVVGKVQLPLGLSNVTTSAGSYDATTGVITYNIGSLTASGPQQLTVTYTQPANSPVTATSAVSTTSYEAGQTANNSAAATTSPTTTTDVATTIGGPATTTAGAQVAYNVTTSNVGTATATSVGQTVTLPSGATNIYVTGGGVINNSTVTFPTIAALAPGQSVNNTVSFTTPSTASFNTVANVTATDDTSTGGNNASTATTTTTAPTTGSANLYTTIAASATNVAAGTSLTFTVTQGNQGPSTAASVVTRVALPTGLPITGSAALKIGGNAPTSTSGTMATYGSGQSAITYDSSTGIVTFATITSQASAAAPASYTLTFNAPASGVLTATSTVASTTPDVMMSNNVASTEVTIDPAATDVATTLTGPDAATPGQRVSYTVTTTNNGPAAATNVAQTVTIPAGLAIAGTAAVAIGGNAPSSTAGTVATYASGATYDSATGLVTLPAIASQMAGNTVSTLVAYTVPANGDASLVNTARVTSTSTDRAPANNAATVVTTIQPSADVQVALTGPSTAAAGALVAYGVTTTNNGPSVASSVSTTVQLPAGLSSVIVIGFDGSPLASAYNSSTGLVTFPAVSGQAPGSANASTGSISFAAPGNVNILTPTATAAVSGTTDPTLGNNSATVATTLAAPTGTANDLAVTLTRSAASATAGSAISFGIAVTNNGSTTATGLIATVQLPAGLPITGSSALTVAGQAPTSTSGTVATYSFPGVTITYDSSTGLLVSTGLSLNAGDTYSATIGLPVAPGVGPVVATATIRADQPDGNLTNNTATQSIAITVVPDVATAISGPSVAPNGGPVSYTVVTSSNGPSPIGGVVQTVTLPAGITGYALNGTAVVLNGGTATTSTTVVTLPTPSTLAAGATSSVANTISFLAPTGTTFNVVANVTGNGDAVAANNAATQTTTRFNAPPVATNITNTLQSPEGSTATAAMLISPLAATSATSTIKQFGLSSIPPTAQGTLYYDNGGTLTAITSSNYANLTLTPAQATTLRFLPASGYVGNATFTYTALDNNNLTSNVATYLIPVGLDNSSVYTASTQVKGGSNKYVTGDVLAYVVDGNTAQYNGSGQMYNATTGVLQSGATNGLANAVLAVGSNSLPSGVSLDPTTGQLYVSDASKLTNNQSAQTYTLRITTTDLNGGTNTQNISFTIGAYPLPVTLVAFTAQAVANRDALLTWTTASEVNNDHFDIERSFDGTTFAAIGQVAGHGTTTTASAYTLTDANVAAKASGPVYYRLRQVDLGGTATYSPVRSVSFTKAATVTLGLYPNPVVDRTTLDLSALDAATLVQTQLLDAAGRAVRSATLAGGQLQPLDLSDLASGSYLLVVTGQQPDGSPLRQVLRLTKE